MYVHINSILVTNPPQTSGWKDEVYYCVHPRLGVPCPPAVTFPYQADMVAVRLTHVHIIMDG